MFENTCRIGGTAVIGYTPERKAREIRFDIGKWQAAWPDAKPEMLVVRPGEEDAYPASTHLDDHEIVWTATQYDTANPGTGRMWVVFLGKDGEQLGLTPMTTTRILPGPPNINGEKPPAGAIPWVKGVFDAADRAEDAAKRAEEIAEALAGGGGGDLDSGLFLPSVNEEDNGKVLTVVGGKWAAETPKEAGVQFKTDETLTLEDGVLSVKTADKVEEDNTLPVTSAAVYTEVGNIEILLKTI